MSHGDRVTELPPGLSRDRHLAERADRDRSPTRARKFYATQFHLEVVHTPHGAALLRNFVRNIAGCRGDWTMRAFKDEAIEKIRAQVGKGRVICGLSGGVDSAVAAVLIHEAIGEQLTCVFVDHGLLRLGEARTGRRAVPRPLQHSARPRGRRGRCSSTRSPASPIRRQSARPSASCSSTCSRRRRRRSAAREFLAQGTLYPDVIESVSFTGGPSVTIKSHHNVGGLPERMNMKLVEPLRELFKDEVRALGRELGLPEAFVGRHPFPGPGLAIRCPGEITREKLDILRLRRRRLHRGNPPRRPLRRRSGRRSRCCCRCAPSA